jgi:hypothetical protein
MRGIFLRSTIHVEPGRHGGDRARAWAREFAEPRAPDLWRGVLKSQAGIGVFAAIPIHRYTRQWHRKRRTRRGFAGGFRRLDSPFPISDESSEHPSIGILVWNRPSFPQATEARHALEISRILLLRGRSGRSARMWISGDDSVHGASSTGGDPVSAGHAGSTSGSAGSVSGVAGSSSGAGGGGGTAAPSGSGGAPIMVPDRPKGGSCGLDNPAFCDTFEQAALAAAAETWTRSFGAWRA